jgi:hypothetical protein
MTKKDLDNARTTREIDRNLPVEISVGRKKYRINRMTNSVQGKIDMLVIESQYAANENDGTSRGIKKVIRMNRRLVPKVMSILILAHPVKIFLWHWIHWRWISVFHYTDEWIQIISRMYDGSELRNFFSIIEYLQANVEVIKNLAKMDTSSIRQSLKSDQETTK